MTERAFAVASPCVVDVDNLGVGSSSGVIYDGSGDIVANAHVVANAQTLCVTECPPLAVQAQALER